MRRKIHPRDRIPSGVSEQERQILDGLASLREETAREVMTPRVDVVALKAPVYFEDAVRAVRRTGHSHFPVYDGDLDHLLGVLFIKDLFRMDRAGPTRRAGGEPGEMETLATGEMGRLVTGEGGAGPDGGSAAVPGPRSSTADIDVTRRAREPFVVPESRSALELLAEMRKLKRSFAVVVDEYGGVAGVVTINDLVSELVGDIRDELDRARSPEITRIDQTRFLVDGAVDVDEVRDKLGIPIPDGEYVTLGGFLFERFGRIPEESDEVDWHGWNLTVTKMDKRRIAKVIVRRPSATIQSGEGSAADGGVPDDQP